LVPRAAAFTCDPACSRPTRSMRSSSGSSSASRRRQGRAHA